MNPSKRRGGPGAMTPTELSEFLGSLPTGALCVENDGQLIALPMQVLDASDETWSVLLSSCGDAVLKNTSPTCLVADSFTSYRTIRGFIAQGKVAKIARVATEEKPDKTVVTVRSSRVRTFSFATVHG